MRISKRKLKQVIRSLVRESWMDDYEPERETYEEQQKRKEDARLEMEDPERRYQKGLRLAWEWRWNTAPKWVFTYNDTVYDWLLSKGFTREEVDRYQSDIKAGIYPKNHVYHGKTREEILQYA